jgi:hypothetical protein
VPHDDHSACPAPPRPPVFALVVSTVLSLYLGAAAFHQQRNAVTAADEALTHGLWVVCGAVVLVAFCLSMRVLDLSQARSRAD